MRQGLVIAPVQRQGHYYFVLFADVPPACLRVASIIGASSGTVNDSPWPPTPHNVDLEIFAGFPSKDYRDEI